MEIIIRPIKQEDAYAIWQMRHMEGVFENLLALPSERLQKNVDFVNSLGEHDHHLVACVNDQVIGEISLTKSNQPRLNHVAYMAMMVHKDYQNQGIGTLLIKAILELADQWLMVRRIELEVYEDNQRAIHLYEKHGFVVEGIKKQAVIKEGKFANLCVMARINEQGC